MSPRHDEDRSDSTKSTHSVTIAVAVIGALATLGAALIGVLGDDHEETAGGQAPAATETNTTAPVTEGPPRTSPSPAETGHLPVTAPPSTAPPDPNEVQWSGVVRLAAGIDLDKIPPTLRTSETNADLWESSSFFVSSIKAHSQALAPWGDSTAPTRQQCADTVSTQGTTEWGDEGGEDITAGDIFCLRTSQGRLAAIQIKDDSYHKMSAKVRVWAALDSL
jgi:hypothetical protein